MLLGLYPIAELTRVIIVSGRYYFPDMDGQFIVEIAVMWVLYLLIIPVYLMINNHIKSDIQKNRSAMKSDTTRRQDSTFPGGGSKVIRVEYKG